jgi:hypothetical protein
MPLIKVYTVLMSFKLYIHLFYCLETLTSLSLDFKYFRANEYDSRIYVAYTLYRTFTYDVLEYGAV